MRRRTGVAAAVSGIALSALLLGTPIQAAAWDETDESAVDAMPSGDLTDAEEDALDDREEAAAPEAPALSFLSDQPVTRTYTDGSTDTASGPLPSQCNSPTWEQNGICLMWRAPKGKNSNVRTSDPGQDLPKGRYGRPTYKQGESGFPATKFDMLDALIDKYEVPRPNRKADTANKGEWFVYQIYGPSMDPQPTYEQTWKFGISQMKRGDRRPKEQLPKCKHKGDTPYDCDYRRRREEINGRFRARMWEAAYFANYRRIMDGDCPPGAKKCI